MLSKSESMSDDATLEIGGLSAWTSTLRMDPNVATPIRFLYRDYRQMCQEDGFPEADTTNFVAWVSSIEGLSITEGGRGSLRRVVLGASPELKD